MPIPAAPPTPLASPTRTDAHPPLTELRALSEADLARRWQLSPKTLQRWRSEGRGPRYLKVSKRITYPVDSVLAFERFSTYESTSQRVTG